MSTTDAAIRSINLSRSYGPASAVVHALRSVSLEVRRGERVALLGKSGSGKSTLLNLLGGLDRPTSGQVLAAGLDLAQLSGYRLTTVGMIFQSFNLISNRTALQNVELPLVLAGVPPARRRRMAVAALEAVGLGERLHHRPSELSGGECQRAAIARGLINSPQILLADEPTGNLDSVTATEVIDVLTEHLDRLGATLVLVTHDEELANRCAARILRLQDGRLVS
ncbi:MAG: ABC transporter ATP-binding protein [Gemmataceae bacterium]